MRNLYANYWDVYFSTDSFQTSLTSKFEIISEIGLSKLHNFDRILQFLPGICATMKPGRECECWLNWTLDRSPQPKKPRNSWRKQKYPEDCKLTSLIKGEVTMNDLREKSDKRWFVNNWRTGIIHRLLMKMSPFLVYLFRDRASMGL